MTPGTTNEIETGMKRLLEQLPDKQARIGVLSDLIALTVGLPAEPEPKPYEGDPLPTLQHVGGVPLEPADKHFFNEALYLMGKLAYEGCIAMAPLPGAPADIGQNYWYGVKIISRALYRVRRDLEITGEGDLADVAPGA